jgi:hypothetical protein
MHAALVVLLPTFAWLTDWQFERATGGNTLSWAYTFEWPLFGVYAIYMWWQLIHDTPTVLDRMRTGATSSRDGSHPDGAVHPHDVPGWALESGRRKKAAAATGVQTPGVETPGRDGHR